MLCHVTPNNKGINLTDDSLVLALANRAYEEFISFCPMLRQRVSEKGGFQITVSLYLDSPKKYQTTYIVYKLDPSSRASLSEYKNYAKEQIEASVKQFEEQRRQAEEVAKLQAQQRAEQARIARENAEREAARQKRWNEFVRKNGIQEMVSIDGLSVNPFVFQGKTVSIHTYFKRMVAPDTGIFGESVVVSGLPRDLFRSRSYVVLAGRVIGTTELKGRELGEPSQAPHLKFIGVHFCKDSSCSDLLR